MQSSQPPYFRRLELAGGGDGLVLVITGSGRPWEHVGDIHRFLDLILVQLELEPKVILHVEMLVKRRCDGFELTDEQRRMLRLGQQPA